jgi:hypothetical protein
MIGKNFPYTQEEINGRNPQTVRHKRAEDYPGRDFGSSR